MNRWILAVLASRVASISETVRPGALPRCRNVDRHDDPRFSSHRHLKVRSNLRKHLHPKRQRCSAWERREPLMFHRLPAPR